MFSILNLDKSFYTHAYICSTEIIRISFKPEQLFVLPAFERQRIHLYVTWIRNCGYSVPKTADNYIAASFLVEGCSLITS
jgi:hypothetical protein